jgi:hypothetical protein
MIFGNINPMLKRTYCKNMTQEIKPAMKNKCNPLLPWPFENVVFKWLTIF